MYKILILYHGFSARSPSSVRRFEKSPRAPRRSLGDFSNPLRTRGDLGENPLNKIRIFYTNKFRSNTRTRETSLKKRELNFWHTR